MPSILILLFLIAIVLTLLGLFLSPRYPTRRSHNEYLVTTRGRRIVESAPIPPRAGRRVQSVEVGTIRRRARAHDTGGQLVAGNGTRRRADEYRAGEQAVETIFGGAYPTWAGSWKVLIPVLAVLFALGLYLFSTLFPYSPIWTVSAFGPSASALSSGNNVPTFAASQHLTRLGQLDPAQYQSSQEYTTWANSACSAASMAEVINAYGHHYHITDILKVEASIGEITPQLGLLEDVGIQRTAARFGFKTAWGHSLSLDQVIAAANNGTPVIVSFPPSRIPGGHLLVVRGGNSDTVYLADSSLRNWDQLTRARFLQLWAGFSAILTPA